MSKTLSEIIRDELGLGKSKQVNESYVTQAQKYDLRTELISQKVKDSHQNLLELHVEALNDISAHLDNVDLESVDIMNNDFGRLKRDETLNMNASYLHALYFDNISDLRSVITMDSLPFLRIERDFGSFDDWQKEFVACGLATGNGWAIMGYSIMLKRYMNVIIDDNWKNVPIGFIPIIVMDCWEHAYYRDYLDDKKTYLYAMMKELNWSKIESRMQNVEKLAKFM
jgi:Fe-Mn family superoxide dismutase